MDKLQQEINTRLRMSYETKALHIHIHDHYTTEKKKLWYENLQWKSPETYLELSQNLYVYKSAPKLAHNAEPPI